MKKILSICIPVYNGGQIACQYIEEILTYEKDDIEDLCILHELEEQLENYEDLGLDIADEEVIFEEIKRTANEREARHDGKEYR